MPLPPERVVVDLPLAEAEVPDVERLVPIIPIEAPELETPLVPAPSAADATQSARSWARSLERLAIGSTERQDYAYGVVQHRDAKGNASTQVRNRARVSATLAERYPSRTMSAEICPGWGAERGSNL